MFLNAYSDQLKLVRTSMIKEIAKFPQFGQDLS